MNDAWKLLGLDQQTATETDVKSAYARLLKLHRPDADPEGFQRVRQAYETAMARLRGAGNPHRWTMPRDMEDFLSHGNSGSRDQRPQEKGTEPVDSTTPQSDPLEKSSAALQQELAKPTDSSLDEAVEDLLRDAARHSVPSFSVISRLRRIFSADRSLLVTKPSAPLLRYLLMHEGTSWLEEILQPDDWEENSVRLITFAKMLRENMALLAHPETGRILARTAELIALEHESVAEELADAAYEQLPVDQRSHALDNIAQRITVGRAFRSFSEGSRRFWYDRFLRPDLTTDWQSPVAMRAVDHVLTVVGVYPDWSGLALVKSVLPPYMWVAVRTRIERVKTPVNKWVNWERRVKKILVAFGVITLIGIGSALLKHTDGPLERVRLSPGTLDSELKILGENDAFAGRGVPDRFARKGIAELEWLLAANRDRVRELEHEATAHPKFVEHGDPEDIRLVLASSLRRAQRDLLRAIAQKKASPPPSSSGKP